MSNSGINKNLDAVISAINNKFDASRGIEAETTANTAQTTAEAAKTAAQAAQSSADAANKVADAAVDLIEISLPQKLDKSGGGITGNLSVSGDLFVGGTINASISGTSENAVKASQDAQGNVIDEHYATKSEVNNLNGSVVHTTNNETINGIKTFTNSPVISTNDPRLDIINRSFSVGSIPESNRYWNIYFKDTNGNYNARILRYINNDGQQAISLTCKTSDQSKEANLTFGTDANGEYFTRAPSTPLTATNNTIVTADYLNSAITLNGRKTFKDIVESNSAFTIKQLDYKNGELPSSNIYWHLNMSDKDSKLTARVQKYVNADGSTGLNLTTFDHTCSASATLGVGFTKDGIRIATAPSTPDNPKETNIVTVDYLSKAKNIVAKDVILNNDYNDLASTRGFIANRLPLYKSLTASPWAPLDMNEVTESGYYHINISQDNTLNSDFVPWTKESGGYADCIIEVKNISTMSYVSSYKRCIQKVTLMNGNIPADCRGIEFIRAQSNGSNGTWQKWYGSGINRDVPVGAIITYPVDATPSGCYLICNGAAISRTTYSRLFAIIGVTYGTGDGITTFNVPNLLNKFIQFSTTAGQIIEPGLPNATGYTSKVCTDQANWSGALIAGADGNTGTTTHGSNVWRSIKLDLSQSNSIFGKSTIVQPPAVTMRPYIKY